LIIRKEAFSIATVEGNRLIRHIFFAAGFINNKKDISAMGLGPMIIPPEY
jgi:hypothetical protein